MLLIRPEAVDAERKLKVKQGAVIGTSSFRRLAQLKLADESVRVEPLRGNVNTRLRKIREKEYEAIVLASAGIIRLNPEISDLNTFELPFDLFLPAPAQGALGLQTRADDQVTINVVSKLNHNETELAVTAEREFLHHFGGGCHVPLGAHATVSNRQIHLTGIVVSIDGLKQIRESVSASDPETAGKELARILKEKGADSLL
jgi:hydroxymethylbilane synthase